MGKLRMKETESERLERERESSKAHRKTKRRKRERASERYYSVSPEPSGSTSKKTSNVEEDVDSDAYVPPRPSKDRPYVPYSYDDDDESRLPPSNAHKQDTTADAEFNERLFDAMREDEGFDPYSDSAQNAGFSMDYRELPNHVQYGVNGVASDRYIDPDTGVVLNRVIFKDAMSEAEYAEHIRRGMYLRTRREEIEREKARERARKEKERKRAEEIARTKALEEERMRQIEERARRKAQAGAVRSREAYQASWARLVDPKRGDEPLRSDDFPWPMPGNTGGSLDKIAIRDFLTSHLVADADETRKIKQAIRTAVLAYHPDRFERYTHRVKDEKERESVREMGLRVSQILNELLQEM